MAAACTNPAALAGGSGPLHAYLSNDGRAIVGMTKPKPWVVPEQPVDTLFVSVPGLLTAKCTSNENASGYLEITVNGNPSDPRVDDIVGDLTAGTSVLTNWGLHLIDVNLSMGNLLDIVGQETKALRRRNTTTYVGRGFSRARTIVCAACRFRTRGRPGPEQSRAHLRPATPTPAR
jgi:hypothetical protein